MRNPLFDPAVGDFLFIAPHTDWHVVDLFVAVDYETGKRRGVVVEIGGIEESKRVCLSLDQFRRGAKEAEVRRKAVVAADWTRARRIAAPLVCAAMRASTWQPALSPLQSGNRV